MIKSNPLVSVVVITYNSSLFIIELLNSIKNQTYDNIELVISDDCSSDNTIELVRAWCDKNDYLDKCIISCKDINEGISYNYNNGLSIATGEYIKFIEGDDVLLPNCIELNMSNMVTHDSFIQFSRAEYFGLNMSSLIIPNISNSAMKRYTRSPKKTHSILLKNDIFVNPTIFVNRNFLLALGGFDNNYKMMVDYPLLINITKHNYSINFFDEVTVRYRHHENNLSMSDKNDRYISELFYKDMRSFYYDKLRRYTIESKNIFTYLEVLNYFYIMEKISSHGNTNVVANKWMKLRYLCFWIYIRKLKERVKLT